MVSASLLICVLEEMLKVTYGLDTVGRIMCGKKVLKAIRAHFLVEAALTVKLL